MSEHKKQNDPVTFISGPMFAGKSSWLVHKYQSMQKHTKCLLVKFDKDNRYDSDARIVTHDGLKTPNVALKASSIAEIEKEIEKRRPRFVFIDEVQFFSPASDNKQIAPDLLRIAKAYECSFFVAGLNSDFRGVPWPTLVGLELVGRHVSLSARCVECGASAAFSERQIKSDETIVIGGTGTYAPKCKLHFQKG